MEEMSKYKVVEAKNKKDLDELYNCSALTIEGLDPDSVDDFADDVVEHSGTVDKVVMTSGKLMNQVYHLTGNNTYPDRLNIVSIIGNTMPMIMRRFDFGGRWFDDVVDNNARREREK